MILHQRQSPRILHLSKRLKQSGFFICFICSTFEAYKNTDYIEWTFKNLHHYKWEKSKNSCSVFWKEYKVDLNLNDKSLNKAYIHGFKVEGEIGEELTAKALSYFNNDSFWLVAPYKVFDNGTERRLVELKNDEEGLLITYTTFSTKKF